MKQIPKTFTTAPLVCAVGKDYQIMVPVRRNCVMWVQIGEHIFYDESNGILRSETDLHRVTVPMEILDSAGAYSVIWKNVIDRKPYSPELEGEERADFEFHPLPEDGIRAYMLADTHGFFDQPVAAARAFEEKYGKINLLILNGDILSHSGSSESFSLYYQLAEAITGGAYPVIISRGNHDLRGKCAEILTNYMPGDHGNSYYTIRLGSVWAVLMDCGEDKTDDHKEYNGVICCHGFRQRQTAFLEDVIRRADEEYLAEGVKHRVVISHVPFSQVFRHPFYIEQDIYAKWVELLNREVKPEFLISGHLHRMYMGFGDDGDFQDAYGAEFPTVVGSMLKREGETAYYAGCGVIWEQGSIRVVFNDAEQVLEDRLLKD